MKRHLNGCRKLCQSDCFRAVPGKAHQFHLDRNHAAAVMRQRKYAARNIQRHGIQHSGNDLAAGFDGQRNIMSQFGSRNSGDLENGGPAVYGFLSDIRMEKLITIRQILIFVAVPPVRVPSVFFKNTVQDSESLVALPRMKPERDMRARLPCFILQRLQSACKLLFK